MPALLRARIAFVTLIGVLLIPIGLSTLRGLSHVLTCREPVAAPFQVVSVDGGQPIVTGATRVGPGDTGLLCGGLEVVVSVKPDGPDRLRLRIPIHNRSSADWRGTVQLGVGGVSIPVDIGRVPAAETRAEELSLRVPTGTVEFDGRLLIGP